MRSKTVLPDILSLFHVGVDLNLDISLSSHVNHTCIVAVLHLISVVKNGNICLSDAGELLIIVVGVIVIHHQTRKTFM